VPIIRSLPSKRPPDEVRGTRGRTLAGKCVVVGVTGSIAAYRAPDMIREIVRLGADVVAAASKEGLRYVTEEVLSWATGREPVTELSGFSEHTALAEECDAMIIAPATANTIAKLAAGIADTAVTLIALTMLGAGKPVIVVPTMHLSLYTAPQTREALSKLKEAGMWVFPPMIEEGKLKFPPPKELALAVDAAVNRWRDAEGVKLVVTAGPTREYLDRIRFLTNPSSGLMGIAIAREAFLRGADVVLVAGPLREKPPYYLRTINVVTTEEMLSAVIKAVKGTGPQAVVLAAAPSDFRFSKTWEGRLRTTDSPIEVELVPTPKISLKVREIFEGLLIGFAAEYAEGDVDRLIKSAREKLEKRGFDAIAANDVSLEGIGFSSPENEVWLVDREGIRKIPRSRKEVIARHILDYIIERVGVKMH